MGPAPAGTRAAGLAAFRNCRSDHPGARWASVLVGGSGSARWESVQVGGGCTVGRGPTCSSEYQQLLS
eukprot:3024548-Rhodomonas_salina.1